MSKQPDSRVYFRLEKYEAPVQWPFGSSFDRAESVRWRIVSIAGGDTIAAGIPSADLAEAMRKGAEEARK